MAERGSSRVRFGFAARIGAALLAPRAALAACDHPEEGGKSVTDLAALLGLTVLAMYTREVVTGGWILASGAVAGGLGSLVGAVSGAVSGELTFLVVLGVSITVFAGRRRALGRDLDLACTALVPLLVVKIAGGLVFTAADLHPGRAVTDALGLVGYGWSLAIAGLAVLQARSRPTDGDGDDQAKAGDEAPTARRGWRRVGWGALAIWGALIAVQGVGVARAVDEVRPVVSGDPAPNFELPVIGEGGALGPETVALAELRGDVVVVEFWATWCGPCRASLPTLERIRVAYEGEPVAVMAVNTEGAGEAASAAAMLRELGFRGISVSDAGRVASQYRVTTIPHLAVISPAGEVVLVHRGFPGEGAYEQKIRSAIDRFLDE